MTRYTHVVVPFDGTTPSDLAVGFGSDLARIFGAKVVTVTSSPVSSPAGLAELKRRALAASDERIEVWLESASNPAAALENALGFRPDALLCMATHGRQGIGKVVAGNLLESVLAMTNGPIVVLGPEFAPIDPSDMRRVLVCVDGSETANTAIPLAAVWARVLSRPCTVICVAAGQPVPDLESAQAALRAAGIEVDALTVATDSVSGGILRAVEAASPCLVVMASHGRTGVQRLLGGSVVSDVIRSASVPVLVQRADGIVPDRLRDDARSSASS